MAVVVIAVVVMAVVVMAMNWLPPEPTVEVGGPYICVTLYKAPEGHIEVTRLPCQPDSPASMEGRSSSLFLRLRG